MMIMRLQQKNSAAALRRVSLDRAERISRSYRYRYFDSDAFVRSVHLPGLSPMPRRRRRPHRTSMPLQPLIQARQRRCSYRSR